LPAWYLGERGIASARELWETLSLERLTPAMRDHGLQPWIQNPEWPFWRARRPDDLPPERAFRRTELELKAAAGIQPKSVFQLVGAGQVGSASLTGMQALNVLDRRGFRIWPFDDRNGPLVVEIFPRVLTGRVVKSAPAARAAFVAELNLSDDHRRAAEASEDAFDALASALVMARGIDELMGLRPQRDYALEGKIWA
jgi:hypothetical protein